MFIHNTNASINVCVWATCRSYSCFGAKSTTCINPWSLAHKPQHKTSSFQRPNCARRRKTSHFKNYRQYCWLFIRHHCPCMLDSRSKIFVWMFLANAFVFFVRRDYVCASKGTLMWGMRLVETAAVTRYFVHSKIINFTQVGIQSVGTVISSNRLKKLR